MKKYIASYLKNFPSIATIVLFVVLAFLVQFFPYINLYAHLFSTLFLLAALVFYVYAFDIRQIDLYKTLFAVLFLSYLLELAKLSYQSEVFGTVFYLLLLYTVVVAAWEHKNDT